MTAYALALMGLAAAALGLSSPPRPLADDERVVLFPSDATFDEAAGQWLVPIHGWVYEPEADDRLRAAAVAALRSTLGARDGDEGPLEERLRLFLVDNQGKKQLRVRVADTVLELPASDRSGHFQGVARVPAAQAEAAAREGLLDMVVLSEPPRDPPTRATARLLARQGVSVISDIDDTVKITQVTDKGELLRNTFQRPFRAAPGMAELYRGWAHNGVAFHFVSSSPWQLFEPLTRFLAETGFPPASLALKRFALADSTLLDLFADPLETKPPAIRAILAAHPERKFCLVGDSGERDPEVYGSIARAYPHRILHVYIRDVTAEPRSAQRYVRAFTELPWERWTLFTDPAAVPPCR